MFEKRRDRQFRANVICQLPRALLAQIVFFFLALLRVEQYSFTFLIQIETLLHDVKSTEAHSLVSIYYDHTTYRSDAPDRNPPLTIADEAMANFIKLTSIHNPHIIPVTSANIEFKLGDQVVVTEGEFAGIYGRVSRIAGQQRVVVELFSGCPYAKNSFIKTHASKSRSAGQRSPVGHYEFFAISL